VEVSVIEFLFFLAVFAVIYAGFCLPVFQWLSKRRRGRKFHIRLGMAWDAGDPEQRWDVLLSFLSFIAALAMSLALMDLAFPP